MTKLSSSVRKAQTQARSKTAGNHRRSFVSGSLLPNSSIHDLAKTGKHANAIELATQE